MNSLIALIEGDEAVSEEQGRAIFEFLTPILRVGPRAEEAIEAARSVLQRMPHDGQLTALLDWWLVVTTAAPPSTAWAYNPPDSLPADIVERMTALVNLSVDGPSSDWIDQRRELDWYLEELEARLQLDWYGQSKLPGERPVWLAVLQEQDPVVEALRESTKAPDVSLNLNKAGTGLVGEGVQVNSRRYKEMMKRFEQLRDFLSAAVEVQHRVAPWEERHVIEPLADFPDVFAGDDRRLEREIARGLLVAEAAFEGPEGLSDEEVLGRIRSEHESCTPAQFVQLARITDPWFTALERSQNTDLRFPDYEQLLAHLHRIDAEVERLAAAEVDTSAIEIHLLDGDIPAAMEAIEAAKTQQKVGDQRERLEARCATIRGRVEDLGLVSEFDERLAETERSIAAGDVESAGEVLKSISEAVDGRYRERLISEVDKVAVELERLDSSPEVNEFVKEVREQLADNSRRPDADAVELVQRELETLTIERVKSAKRNVEAVEASLAELESTAPEDMMLEWRAQLGEFQSMLEQLELPYSVDDAAAIFSESADLFPEIESQRMRRWVANDGETELVDHIIAYCTQELAFDETDIRRLYVAIKTKPFVILAGLTGSGKSTIARLFAESLGATSKNGGFRRVAVRPDWIDQSEVLGFVNPMKDRFDPGWLAKAVRDANASPDRIFVVLVDELNLAPVEQYLAEFLSASEEARSSSHGALLPLYNEGIEVINGDEWPPSLEFPPNLIVIGTVNMDETTRVLSERVIDRASVPQLSTGVSDEHHVPRRGTVAAWEVPYSEWRRIIQTQPIDDHHDYLVEVADTMKGDLRIGLGIRTHIEIERFAANAAEVFSPEDALDIAMLHRVIPKIKGFKRDLADGLDELKEMFVSVGANRCALVLAGWLAPTTPDDEYLDGTSHLVGLIG